MSNASVRWILLAAAIATVGAVIHVAAIVGGPSWYVWFNAPPSVVASARAGTWLAPVSAAVIALLMGLCALYACSAAGLVRRLPLLVPGLASIAAVCLLRALVLIPLAVTHPELRNAFELVAAIVWGAAGLGFAVGVRAALPPRSASRRMAAPPRAAAPSTNEWHGRALQRPHQ